jgi:hypothetical protein
VNVQQRQLLPLRPQPPKAMQKNRSRHLNATVLHAVIAVQLALRLVPKLTTTLVRSHSGATGKTGTPPASPFT